LKVYCFAAHTVLSGRSVCLAVSTLYCVNWNTYINIVKTAQINLLSSYRWSPLVKYVVKIKVLLMHWRAEFMKHVLPRLFSPVAPRSIGTTHQCSYYSASTQHNSHYLQHVLFYIWYSNTLIASLTASDRGGQKIGHPNNQQQCSALLSILLRALFIFKQNYKIQGVPKPD